MNILTLDIYNYNARFFYYLDTQPNILMNGLFTKMIYTHPHYTMNGLYFHFPIQYTYIEPCKDKYYVHFDPKLVQNKAIMENIYKLETRVLDYYQEFSQTEKCPLLTMHKHLSKGKFRIPHQRNTTSMNPCKYMFKISGVWESENEFGITYKWFEIKDIKNNHGVIINPNSGSKIV